MSPRFRWELIPALLFCFFAGAAIFGSHPVVLRLDSRAVIAGTLLALAFTAAVIGGDLRARRRSS